MKNYSKLLIKIVFFLIVIIIFGAPPAFISGNLHHGIAGGPDSGAFSGIKTILGLGALIIVPLLLIVLTGWTLFGKRSDNKKP